MTVQPTPTAASRDARVELSTSIARALVFLPAALSCLLLYLLRLPFPYQDDFKALLAFAVRYDQAQGFAAKGMNIAATSYNHYHLIFQHLVVAAEVELTHGVNFGFLTGLGNLFLVGIALLLWFSFERELFEGEPQRDKLIAFLPVSLLFFGLSYWETLNWAMAELQNLSVIFFALAALYLLVPRKTAEPGHGRVVLACVAACLSCCSSANGFLLAPVGVALLVSRRWYGRAGLWLLSFVLPLYAYQYHGAEAAVQYGFHARQIFYFVAFFGGALPSHLVAFVLGAVLLAVLVWAGRSGLSRLSPALFYLAMWIVLTGALVESVRGSLASRYSIYSVLLLICCYTFVLQVFKQRAPAPIRLSGVAVSRRGFATGALVFALLFYVQADLRAFTQLRARRSMVVRGFRYYRLDPSTNSPQANPEVDLLFPDETPFELNMLKELAKDHLYTAPTEEELGRF